MEKICKKALNKLQNTRVVAEKTAIALQGMFVEAKNKVEKAISEAEQVCVVRDMARDAVDALADGTATDDELKAAAKDLTEKAMICAEKMMEVVAAENELDLLPEVVNGAIRYYRRFERLQERAIDLFESALSKSEGVPLYLRFNRVGDALEGATSFILTSDWACCDQQVNSMLQTLDGRVRKFGGRR